MSDVLTQRLVNIIAAGNPIPSTTTDPSIKPQPMSLDRCAHGLERTPALQSIMMVHDVIDRYVLLTCLYDEDSYTIRVSYGRRGRTCRTPLIRRFTTQHQAIAESNGLIDEVRKFGYVTSYIDIDGTHTYSREE